MILHRPKAVRSGKLSPVALALLFVCFISAPRPTVANQLSPSDLATYRVCLSYVAPERCVQLLQLYGFTVSPAGRAIDPDQLPVIVQIPSTTGHDLLPEIKNGFPMTEADPIGDLLVFYHPDHPEQLSKVLHRIEQQIDLPARQIMLEAMVLEVSEESMNRLGVDWNIDNVIGDTFQMGRVGSTSFSDNHLLFGANAMANHFNVRLQALIREGEAEVLSRPSVLTLNNRTAFINVSKLIPIPESKYHSNSNVSTVDFREKEVGIKLSIRPRITVDGEEVSLQVNASVSAVVPNQDVNVYVDEDVIASSPTISVREVKTYARIANNTPFIIGGLIARDDSSTRDRVPVLGALPFVGKFFSLKEDAQLKREVIIVITPFVLPEGDLAASKEVIGPNLPQDDDKFDSIGNSLFRDAYRIREEDVYELGFLTKNEELMRLQMLADEAVAENMTLADQYPYSAFINGRIPGENMLVFRQIYSVIRRVGLDEKVDENNLIFFNDSPDRSSGLNVSFLNEYLTNSTRDIWQKEHDPAEKCPESVWDALGDRALALIYVSRRNHSDPEQILYEQVPEVKIIPCKGRDEYKKILWDLNQPDDQGRMRGTILLNTERDMQRLKQALVLRKTIRLNGAKEAMTLTNFNVGRRLLLPANFSDNIDLVDGEIAHLALITDRYYDLLREELARSMNSLRKELGENE